jgi:hypothetical protein
MRAVLVLVVILYCYYDFLECASSNAGLQTMMVPHYLRPKVVTIFNSDTLFEILENHFWIWIFGDPDFGLRGLYSQVGGSMCLLKADNSLKVFRLGPVYYSVYIDSSSLHL